MATGKTVFNHIELSGSRKGAWIVNATKHLLEYIDVASRLHNRHVPGFAVTVLGA